MDQWTIDGQFPQRRCSLMELNDAYMFVTIHTWRLQLVQLSQRLSEGGNVAFSALITTSSFFLLRKITKLIIRNGFESGPLFQP